MKRRLAVHLVLALASLLLNAQQTMLANPCPDPACVVNYMSSWPPVGYLLETASLSVTAVVEELAAEPTLRLNLPGQHPQNFNAADLRALPHKTISFYNAHTNTDETYSGVPLNDLLTKYGAPTGKGLHGKALSDYIVATGSDGYKAVLSLAETDPSFHPGEVIVADSMDGKPLDAKEGPFKLLVTEDKRPARSVHNLVSIELKSVD